MKKLLFAGLLAAVLAGVLGLAGLYWSRDPMSNSASAAGAGGPRGEPAPEFPEGTQWVQSEPLKLGGLRGQVVIVHFWTFGCVNCIRNYPVYRDWQEKYAGKGVTLIGVHTPEFAAEADADRVRAKARDNGLTFPIAIDNGRRIWTNWDNHYWPAIYLIDKKGQVRYRWEGELHLDTVEGRQFASRIDELLAEKP